MWSSRPERRPLRLARIAHCSCDSKNTGNSGNNGNIPGIRGLQPFPKVPFCCRTFFCGNRDNQKLQSESALILKRRCVLPVVATFFIGWQPLQAIPSKAVASVATDSRFL